MSKQVLASHEFCESELESPQVLSVAGGHAALFSRRCPGKSSVNEDAAAVFDVSDSTGVLVVADGAGGMQSGNAASSQAVKSMAERLLNLPDSSNLRAAVLDAIESANDRICAMGANAATTFAALEIQSDTVRPYHVGDSMILLCGQRGRLRWQSIAHSPVGYAVEAGVIDEADAMSHPDRHYVSNLVGCPEMRIEMGPQLKMSVRDTLLICSDGLSDNLSTDEIVSIIRCGDLAMSVQQLVDLATQRMKQGIGDGSIPSKPDDLTIVAFRRAQKPGRRARQKKTVMPDNPVSRVETPDSESESGFEQSQISGDVVATPSEFRPSATESAE